MKDVRAVLDEHPKGRVVLAVYQRENRLNKATRQMLVEVIVHRLMQEHDE